MGDLRIPKHIGIIPDGNRRWAKKLGKQPWDGHRAGASKFEEILEWCRELGIKIVTIYTLSLENFSRSKEELAFLMDLLKREFNRMTKDKKVHENKVRINIIGRVEMLSQDVQDAAINVTNATKDYSDYVLNFAVAYGGRAEIVDAAKRIAQTVKEGKIEIASIDEDTFSKNLYSQMPDVDLIIRTSEQRLSGFLPWQSTYAEIIFLPKFFPDLTKEDFLDAIQEYSNRGRRFGG